jgi:hypothetical protein
MLTLALQGKHLEAAGVTLVSLYRQALLYCNHSIWRTGRAADWEVVEIAAHRCLNC